MARYVVKTKITSSDPTNLSYVTYKDQKARDIIFEYINGGQLTVLQDVIETDHRIVWHSFDSKEIFLEMKERLNALGDYHRDDVTVEIFSQNYT